MAEGAQNLVSITVSCADLIRASIVLHEKHLARMMDCRAKASGSDAVLWTAMPGNDEHTNTAQTREQS
jgi:hypothetical protein